MSPESWYKFRVGLYVVCILAYCIAFVDFLVEWKNYWACAGYIVAAALMSLRLFFFMASKETLYRLFPLQSIRRAVFQVFFVLFGLSLFGLGFWLLALGVQRSEKWTGSSYYCSMIGIWCGAKWGLFITIPIYDLRPDVTDEEFLAKVVLEMKQESRLDDLAGLRVQDAPL